MQEKFKSHPCVDGGTFLFARLINQTGNETYEAFYFLNGLINFYLFGSCFTRSSKTIDPILDSKSTAVVTGRHGRKTSKQAAGWLSDCKCLVSLTHTA